MDYNNIKKLIKPNTDIAINISGQPAQVYLWETHYVFVCAWEWEWESKCTGGAQLQKIEN